MFLVYLLYSYFGLVLLFFLITYTSSLFTVYYLPNLKKLMRIWGCSWNFAVAEDVNKKGYDNIGRSSAEKKGINFSNDWFWALVYMLLIGSRFLCIILSGDCYFLLVNPKDVDGQSKSMLQVILSHILICLYLWYLLQELYMVINTPSVLKWESIFPFLYFLKKRVHFFKID